ncbi:MAG: DUF2933 domain-containing protein [Candidatus Woesebacteria bacterium]|nr:DUF2933 domain-containing protein [Candidatus Woesebacteria bacterium]
MKKNTILKWVGICIVLVIIAFVALSIFKVTVNNLFFYGIILLCPLMHLFMMKNGHKH